MAEVPQDKKKLLFGMGIKWHGTVSMIMNILGLVCLIMGIISSAMDEKLWLLPMYWLLLAIAFMIFALSAWLTAYHAAKEGYDK